MSDQKPLPTPNNKLQIKSFACPQNQKTEVKKRIIKIYDCVNVSVPPLKDYRATITFNNEYNEIPWIHYYLICPDELCQLNTYLFSVGKKSMDIIISNISDQARNVQICYSVKNTF